MNDAAETPADAEVTDVTVVEGGELATANEQALTLAGREPPRTIEQFTEWLDTTKDWRAAFREWLMGQLVEGVHFGYPPGTEPRLNDAGELMFKGKAIPRKQWRAKPMLYAAGADFLCDCLKLRAMPKTDKAAWEMAGSIKGLITVSVDLFITPACPFRFLWPGVEDGGIVATGFGAYQTDNYHDANAAMKMAAKCGKTAAMMDALGLRDAFVQDGEGNLTAKAEEPVNDNAAPEGKPRERRAAEQPPPDPTKARVVKIWKRWLAWREYENDVKHGPAFATWARNASRTDADLSESVNWTADHCECCEISLADAGA